MAHATIYNATGFLLRKIKYRQHATEEDVIIPKLLALSVGPKYLPDTIVSALIGQKIIQARKKSNKFAIMACATNENKTS